MICPECNKYETDEGAGMCPQCTGKWSQKQSAENHKGHYVMKGYDRRDLCRKCGRPKLVKNSNDIQCECAWVKDTKCD